MSVQDPVRESPEIRLARSRAELLALFEPEDETRGSEDGQGERRFPRSLTMRLLKRGAGTGGLLALAVALFAISPSKTRQLLRYVPVNAIVKILVARLVDAPKPAP
ncbi:MAG: hypothetical protein JSR95_19465 [Proteobacteria bacterium]|nr:hypothetical protein [Pseudomonadota bacterium]